MCDNVAQNELKCHPSSTGDPPTRGDLAEAPVAAYAAEVKELLNWDRIVSGSNVPKIREEAIDKLVAAINATDQIAREASSEPAKGGGGMAPTVHWYRVPAYLVQVLDGL